MHMTVDMLVPTLHDKVLDPACGTGGFLVVAMNKVIEDLENIMTKEFGKPKQSWTKREDKLLANLVDFD